MNELSYSTAVFTNSHKVNKIRYLHCLVAEKVCGPLHFVISSHFLTFMPFDPDLSFLLSFHVPSDCKKINVCHPFWDQKTLYPHVL